MAIDGDGRGGGKDGDSSYQTKTALQVNGKSLDARQTPFIVIPGDFSKAHKDVALGDFAAVTYGGKTYYAIVGDIGPKGVLGEASPAVARAVGIDPHPVTGGIRSASVRYWILPKSARRPPPTGDAEIQNAGRAAFAAAGAELK
ncbi:MAG: glycoside hydrolase family 75 protein [Elusimicrobia bacterium]|nr:glycoside hydrolase family 75 protein [Elusimicrobiota bacterium]